MSPPASAGASKSGAELKVSSPAALMVKRSASAPVRENCTASPSTSVAEIVVRTGEVFSTTETAVAPAVISGASFTAVIDTWSVELSKPPWPSETV